MRLFPAGAVLAAVLTVAGAAVQAQRGATPPARPSVPAPQAPLRDAPVPFKPGETLTYDVSWSQFLTAGTATVKVVDKTPSGNSSAYRLQADGRPIPFVERFYPVYYKVESMLDSVTMLVQQTSLYAEESGQKQQATTRFDRRAQRAFYQVQGEPPARDGFAIPATVQDGLSALYTIRGRQFRAGDRFSVPVADGGAVYSAEFATSKTERIIVPLGPVEAWKIDVTIRDAGRQPMTTDTAVWISNDARRLPVKMQSNLPIGLFILALREAQ